MIIKFSVVFSILYMLALSGVQAQNIYIVPAPQKMVPGKETIKLTPKTRISACAESIKTATYLQNILQRTLGAQIALEELEKRWDQKGIYFAPDSVAFLNE